ncbi:hypothetical protein K7432_005084 [Basidiobolus ranarum]|uniref:Uncharacterized protein n=1 Tax=Basidiobolus ranarum TaxID=34480 RepID=A0ABR2WX70_9FUNG
MKVYALLTLISLSALYVHGQVIASELSVINSAVQPSSNPEPSKPPTADPGTATTPPSPTNVPATPTTQTPSTLPSSPSVSSNSNTNPSATGSRETPGGNTSSKIVDSSVVVIPPVVTFTLPGSNGITAPPMTLSIPSTASGSAVTTLPNSDVVKDVVVTATAKVSGTDAVVLATVRVTGKPMSTNTRNPSFGVKAHTSNVALVGVLALPLLWSFQ